MARIIEAVVRTCTQALRDPSWKFSRASLAQLDGRVLELTDDEGQRGLGQHLIDDPFEELPVVDGAIGVSRAPGCGIGYTIHPPAIHQETAP